METSHLNKKIFAFLLASGGIIMFSAKAIFVKMAYTYQVDTVSLLLIRMVMALPFYILIAIFSSYQKMKIQKMNIKQVFTIAALGFAGYYLASYFDFAGLSYISAGLERLVLFIYPTLVVLITAILYKRKVPGRQALAIIVTYFGVFLAFFQNANLSGPEGTGTGVSLVLASALTYAFYLVGSGTIIPQIGSVRFTSYAMIISCLSVVLHYYLKGNTDLFDYPKEVYRIGAGMAIISTLVPSFMISEAIKRIGPSRVAIISSIGPISTIILASIFLGETIEVFQILGTIVVISGVMLVNLDSHGKNKVAHEEKKLVA